MAKNKPKKVKDSQFVTKEEFNNLTEAVGSIADLLKESLAQKSSPAQTAAEITIQKEAEKAVPNKYTVNPEWEEIAREIIGAAVDHTEIEYIKGGGMKFTVVIKDEFSNASVEYLERHKVDRRSREVGAEGESGVRVWCEQIRNNLKRPKNITS